LNLMHSFDFFENKQFFFKKHKQKQKKNI